MRFLTILLACWAAARGLAHPGNGILVLEDGRVLTGDAVGNGIWLFERGKPPQRQTSDFHCHWLTRGLDGRLYAENQGEADGHWTTTHYRLDGLGTRPVRLGTAPLTGSCFTADIDGGLVMVVDGKVVVSKRAGSQPFRGDGRVVPGDPPLGSVSALVWGPRDVLYLADGPRVRKVGADGRVRLVTSFTGRATVSMYAGPKDTPRIWGLSVDAGGGMIVALASHGEVVRIAPSGDRTVIARSQNGWIATGVATRGDSTYLLETKLEGNRNLGPRVRQVEPGGRWTVFGTVPRR